MTLLSIKRGDKLSKAVPQLFVTVPDPVRKAALTSFGKCNIYIQIGNATDKILAGIDLRNIYSDTRVTKDYPYLLSLVLIFQFNEGLADRQTAEATRIRADWKYALHLSPDFPGVNPHALCDFRQRLSMNDSHKAKFQLLLSRVQEFFCLKDVAPAADVDFILRSVCSRSRLELAASTMQAAIQALTVTRYEWLSRIMRPHWYQRYSPTLAALVVPEDLKSQIDLTESIGIDGFYLLETIARTSDPELAKLSEVQQLKRIWEAQFERFQPESWKQAIDCSNCGVRFSK